MIPDAYMVAKMAKRINENVKVIMDGPHVTFVPERTFEECPYVDHSKDYIVRGEGEITFKEFVDTLEKNDLEKNKDPSNILGLSINLGDKVKNNPPRPLIKDVDTIPMPSYDLLTMEKYQVDRIRFGTVMTSRGCPQQYIFLDPP